MSRKIDIPNFKSKSRKTGEKSSENLSFAKGNYSSKSTSSVTKVELYQYTSFHDIASAGFESATFWLQVTYMLDIQRNWNSKLSNVPLLINVFWVNIILIILFKKNFTTKNGIWLNLSAIYLHCSLCEESCTGIWEFRPPAGHPHHGRVRFFYRLRLFFGTRLPFKNNFILRTCFILTCIYFFLLCLSSFCIIYFCLCFFVYFHIWFILIIFYFQHSYIFFRI